MYINNNKRIYYWFYFKKEMKKFNDIKSKIIKIRKVYSNDN